MNLLMAGSNKRQWENCSMVPHIDFVSDIFGRISTKILKVRPSKTNSGNVLEVVLKGNLDRI